METDGMLRVLEYKVDPHPCLLLSLSHHPSSSTHTTTPNRVEQGTGRKILWWKQDHPGLGYRILPVTGKKELCLQGNLGLIKGFPRLFLVLPGSVLQRYPYSKSADVKLFFYQRNAKVVMKLERP